MRKAHKIFFLLQFIAFIFIIVYQTMAVNPEILLGLFAVVFVLEIGILEQQNKYRKEEVFYHKSGFFALLDLLTVIVFLIKFSVLILSQFFRISFLENKFYVIALILYTIIRKIYIYKNYTYEK